jgi:aminopeptidase
MVDPNIDFINPHLCTTGEAVMQAQVASQWSGIAENIVKHSLRIRRDDVVTINAARHMLDLADEVARQCRLAGAETATAFWSEQLWYWSIETLPMEWLRAPNKVDLAMLDVATAAISMTGMVDPTPMSRIPADRWTANSDGANPYYRKSVQRHLRTANVNLSLVTSPRAAAYGFQYKEWKQNVEDSLTTDFSKLQATGKKLAGAINGSSAHVQVTSKNGTNVTFRLAERKSRNDDGVLDEEDLAAGTFETNLPAGHLRVAPSEESANGRVTFDLPVLFAGKRIENVSWVLKDGNVTEFTASRNADLILDLWKKSTGDKSKFGWFGLGFNPATRTGFMNDPNVSGAATLGIGENTDLDGKNQSTFGLQSTISKPTVTMDGKVIVKDGTIEL